MIVPSLGAGTALIERSFAVVLWQDRSLDVLVQIVLIFAGVIGILGLLAEARVSVPRRIAEKQSTQPVQPVPVGSPARSTPEEVRA
jgi:hypothetical protein